MNSYADQPGSSDAKIETSKMVGLVPSNNTMGIVLDCSLEGEHYPITLPEYKTIVKSESGVPPVDSEVNPVENGTGYPDTVPTIIRPGYALDHMNPGWSQAMAICGEVRSVVVCPEDPAHVFIRRPTSCGKSRCPICCRYWMLRATTRAVSRIRGYRRANHIKGEPRHITVSPPPGRFSPADSLEERVEEMQRLLRESNDLMDALGIDGAAIIPHCYRIRREKAQEINDAVSKDPNKPNRYTYALSQPNWEDYVVWSPHVHMLGFGYLMNAAEFHAKTGWVYKNHGARGGQSLEKTIFYLLTHAWIRGKDDKAVRAVRYWRGMSTRNLACVLTIEKVAVICPVCCAVLRTVRVETQSLIQIRNTGDHSGDPPLYRKVEHRKYWNRSDGNPEILAGMPDQI